MKISYYLNPERKKNLYCRISDGTERVTFSLEHEVDPKKWNATKEEFKSTNDQFGTLKLFKDYLNNRYLELKAENKSDILARLKTEARSFIPNGAGLKGIARQMFDTFHKNTDVPEFDAFVEAFEKHSRLEKGAYTVEILDSSVLFHTADETFIIDTYEGKTLELKNIIDRKSYDEISLYGNIEIWNEIFIDPGIGKEEFMPRMFTEWEIYWHHEYSDVRERTGNTSHLDALKTASWRQFQVFMECYENGGNIMYLAAQLDDMILFPIAVITMLQMYDAETCYHEYCEQEFFGSGEWETIASEKENEEDAPTFFIKTYEF